MLLDALNDGSRAEPVGHQGEHGSSLGLLRLGKGSQVVALVGDHLRQTDAYGADRWHESTRCLTGPALRRTKNFPDPLVRLGLRGLAPGRVGHDREKNRIVPQRQPGRNLV